MNKDHSTGSMWLVIVCSLVGGCNPPGAKAPTAAVKDNPTTVTQVAAKVPADEPPRVQQPFVPQPAPQLAAAPDTSPLPAQPAVKKDDSPAERAAAALYGDIRQETLPNGLKVYMKPIPGAATVTTMVAYQVGSADEELDRTGLSHYLEHLMFKGTEKLKPGDIDRMTLRNGGQNNAYTAEDHTIFHFDFASDRWLQALEVEADRMRNLRIDTAHEFEQEKGAVIEELRQNEDQPWDLEGKAILPVLFGEKSPYGHPIIGQTVHVRTSTAEIIKGHYDRWYHPNNASLIICGGFDPEEALARVKELFGGLPKTELPPRKTLPDANPQRPATIKSESKFDSPRLLLGFNAVRRADADYAPLDIVQGVLTGGKTGRLYRMLVEDHKVASEVSSANIGGRYPGWFSVQVTLLPEVKLEDVEKLVLEELRQLGRNGITESELNRVQQLYLTQSLFAHEGVHELCDSIAQAAVLDNLDFVRGYLPSLMAVKPADVRRVAAKYLDPKLRVAVHSIPKDEDDAKPDTKPETKPDTKPETKPDPAQPTREKASRLSPRGASPRHNARSPRDTVLRGSAANVANILKGVRREVLENGLTLLLLENHRLPIVTVETLVKNTRLLEPAEKAGVATLVGDLLSEGTPTRTGPVISETIEDLGGTLVFDQAGGVLNMLATHRTPGLEVLFDCLANADFPQDAFDRGAEQLLAELDDHEKHPEMKAQVLFREAVYGQHPYARPEAGKRETVEKLTRDDCLKYHRRLFVPNNVVVALVGDFNSQELIDEIKRLTKDWKQQPVDKPALPEVKLPEKFVQKIAPMPQASQLHLFLGHVGVRRNNPDYFKLQVMDYVLGTGPGFTDRLSAHIRDREGLAYSVGADITSSAGEEPGMFNCHIGTAPENFARVKDMLLKEMNTIIAEPPTKQEVDDAKLFLTGSLAFKVADSKRLAGEMLEIERYNLGANYLGDYLAAIEAVTVEDVFTVAKKYLHPDQMALIASGAIDENGKPTADKEEKDK